jgi:hypothetical protein
LILAAVSPDNTPNGYYWTFLFPMLLFIFIGSILYLLFSRPHRRIPARMIALRSRPVGPYSASAPATTATGGPADAAGETSGDAAEGKEETE